MNNPSQVDRLFRRQGVTLSLLRTAIDYGRSQVAPAIEGYPVKPGSRLYNTMGSVSTFRRAGFCDVTPAGKVRLLMRLYL